MSHWWSQPVFWFCVSLGMGLFMLILAPVQVMRDQKRLFYGISRVSLSVAVLLGGLAWMDGYMKAVVIILGLLIIWFLGSFLSYLWNQADEPEAPRAQLNA